MKRNAALEIAKNLQALDAPMNAAIAAVENIEDIDQRRRFRRAFAQVVGLIYTNIFMPLGQEFPDLLPDKQDFLRTSNPE